jgi:oligopeptide transport system substrate-binding protein
MIFIMIIVLFAGCTSESGGQLEEAEKVLKIAQGSEPPAVDPARANDNISLQIGQALFEGLYRYHNGEFIEGMAEGEPEISEDGLVWTFHLRDAKWSDGEPVTAHDFEYAWKRLADPETASGSAYKITDFVKGAMEFNQGSGSSEDVGVRAVNDKTLEVTLVSSTPYFKEIISFGAFSPVREDIVKEYGEAFAANPENMVYNGPWALTKWEHDVELEFEPNENYWNREAVKLDRVISPIISDYATQVNMFETGDLHMTILMGEFAAQYDEEGKAEFFEDGLSINLLLNRETYEPFANENIRKAFALAIDRESFITNIYKLPAIPATNLINPAIKGVEKTFRDEFPGDYFPAFDSEKAKELLQKGLDELGIDSLPDLELMFLDGGASPIFAEFLQENFRKTLEVEAVLTPISLEKRIEISMNGDYQTLINPTGPDFNDPMSTMETWITGNPYNEVKYENEDYDTLVKEAKGIDDTKKRMELMAQAEELIMEDMYVVPIMHNVSGYAISDNVSNLYPTAWCPDIDWMFADMEEAEQ